MIKKIAEFEREIFTSSAYSYENLVEISKNNNYKIFYYEEENEILGYMIVMDSIDCFEILKIAVLKEYRNKGVATKLLENIKNKDIFLEVRESNEAAIKFYQKQGFTKISIRKNYYKDNNENAIIMKLGVLQ